MKFHKCMAKGCRVDVPRAKLMCPQHWKGLPADIKAEVLETWDNRRASEQATVDAHMAACRRAIKFYMSGRGTS